MKPRHSKRLDFALEGQSLVPLLVGDAVKVKDAAFSQFPRKHDGRDYMGYAMRTERYRYIEWIDQRTGTIAARASTTITTAIPWKMKISPIYRRTRRCWSSSRRSYGELCHGPVSPIRF